MTRFILLSTLLALPLLAQAQSPCVQVRYVPPSEVGARAGMIVRGVVESRECVPSPRPPDSGPPVPIYTEIRLRITEVWKGDQVRPGDTLSFRHGGGTWQEYTTVEGPIPNYAVGDTWVMAIIWTDCGWWTTWGLSQGAFKVEGDKATRSYEGLTFVDGTPQSLRTETFSLADLREKMTGTTAAGAPPSTSPRPGAAVSPAPAAPGSGNDAIRDPPQPGGSLGGGSSACGGPLSIFQEKIVLVLALVGAIVLLVAVSTWRTLRRGD